MVGTNSNIKIMSPFRNGTEGNFDFILYLDDLSPPL